MRAYVVEGSSVDHIVESIDWREHEGEAYCGATGELVHADVEEIAACGNCVPELPEGDLRDELVDETEDDESDDG